MSKFLLTLITKNEIGKKTKYILGKKKKHTRNYNVWEFYIGGRGCC